MRVSAVARMLATLSITTVPAAAVNATEAAVGRTVIDVLGQSGRFTVYNDQLGRGRAIQVLMDSLTEVDSNGSAVGSSGSEKHSIQTFAAQDFNFTHNDTVAVDGVAAQRVSFQSPVSTVGVITVDTYIMQESGVVGPPGEQWNVSYGDLKWNIKLSSWQWCGCRQGQTQETGAYIDVVVTVQGLATVSQNGPKSLDMGGGMTCELSDQVLVDNQWMQMPTGYPMISNQGRQTTFTFRFPKFNTSAVYDPLVTGVTPAPAPAPAPPQATSAAPWGSAPFHLGAVALVLAMAVVLAQ